MKHEDAIEKDALSRYLLGQMPEDEQEIFEEHAFDCAICAAGVTDGTRMMVAGRFVVEEEREEAENWTAENLVLPNVDPMPIPMPAPKPPWWNLPMAATASLAFTLLGYVLATPWHDRTGIVNVVGIETGVSRAATPAEIPLVRPGDALRFDVEPSDDAVAYDAVISCGGKTESTDRISREMAADAVTLRIGELPAGRCELVIQGVRKDGKRFPITSSPFQVGES